GACAIKLDGDAVHKNNPKETARTLFIFYSLRVLMAAESTFFSVKTYGIEQRSIARREQDGGLFGRFIAEAVPMPRWDVEAVVLAPFERVFVRLGLANLGNACSAHHVVDCATGVPVAARFF